MKDLYVLDNNTNPTVSFDTFEALLLHAIKDTFYDDNPKFVISLSSQDYHHEYTVVEDFIVPVCLEGNLKPSMDSRFILDVSFKSSLLPSHSSKVFFTFEIEDSIVYITARFGRKHALSKNGQTMRLTGPWHIRIGDALKKNLVLSSDFAILDKESLSKHLTDLMSTFDSNPLAAYIDQKDKVFDAVYKHCNADQ